jgi:hypothetical protein
LSLELCYKLLEFLFFFSSLVIVPEGYIFNFVLKVLGHGFKAVRGCGIENIGF